MNSETQGVTLSGSGPPVPVRSRCRNVFILDDDEAVCHDLTLLFASKGYTVKSFTCPESLLAVVDMKTAGVLILDLIMTKMSGLALQAELRNRDINLKTIFISEHGDIAQAVQAIKGGAINLIEKPCTNQQLLNSVEEALFLVNAEEKRRRQTDRIGQRYERLTTREREIMNFLVRGESSRKLAERLGLSSRTVEIHRSKIMHKMEVTSVPDLVRMVYMNGISQPEEVLIDIHQSLQFQDDQNF